MAFRGQKKLGPRPDWSPLGVEFKISDEHSHPFHVRNFPLGFRASHETMASAPEGQLSDQSDIPANNDVSEVVINCVVSKDNL